MSPKYNQDIYRSGETSQQYVVPAADSTTAGSYTCTVTISGTTSGDSVGYTVTATGLLFDLSTYASLSHGVFVLLLLSKVISSRKTQLHHVLLIHILCYRKSVFHI